MNRNRDSKRRRTVIATNSRCGIAALELVITTGLMIPSLALLLFLGFQVCRNYFSVAGSMMGAPF